jgi:hypothetical protein
MTNSLTARIVSAAALGALLLGASTQRTGAWSDVNHREYLTFSGPVAIPGAVLPAGTYIFEMPTSSFSNTVVSIRSRDGRKVFLTQFTRIVDRPRAQAPHVSFHEAARGVPPPVDTWYPSGGDNGRQLIYE